MDDDFYSNPQKMFASLAAANPNLPIPSLPSFAAVKREAAERSINIFDNWNRLHQILERHEVVIRKRWMKKSKQQREKVLLSAWPGMATTHRPDFHALKTESEQARRHSTGLRDAYLFPYINLEDLSKAKNLLLLLHARGHTKPDVFAFFDLETQQIGRASGAIVPQYLASYTMLLTGETSPSTYGRLLSWDDDPDAWDLWKSQIGFQPGEGLMVMEIQDRLHRFLVQCAESIVADLIQQKEPEINSSFQPPPPISELNTETEWPSIAAAIAETPYRVPLQFDLARVRVLVNAKRLEYEDHIYSLREDPGYFQDCAMEWSEHRPERSLNANGKAHPNLQKSSFWKRVLGSVVIDAYGGLLMWKLIEDGVERLAILRQREDLSVDKPLSAEYARELCHFQHLLKQARKGPMSSFRLGIAASPPLRSDFVRLPSEDPYSTVIRTMSKPAKSRKGDYLLWLISQLVDEDQTFLCGLSNLLDEMDRVIRINSNSAGGAQKERISSWISRVLSDLSVIGELEWRISLHQPGIGIEHPVEQKDLFAEFSKRSTLFAKFFEAGKTLKLVDVGTPLRRFDHPSSKPRTATSMAKLCEAESQLDQFWAFVDDHFKLKTGSTLGELLADVLVPRPPKRTPEWVDPIPAPSPATIAADPIVTDAFSAFDIQEHAPTDVISPVKLKLKTRGPAVIADNEIPPTIAPADQPPAPTIQVTKRAYKVFSVLFHNAAYESPPGEIPWSEFLHALSSAGFAVEKQYGSAWMFTPSAESGQRNIIFHEPHPINKIPYHLARQFGRRLERVYGWTGETFINMR